MSWILNGSSFTSATTDKFDLSVIAASNAILNNFDKNSAKTTYLGLYVSLYVYHQTSIYLLNLKSIQCR